MGLVTRFFSEQKLQGLRGDLAIGSYAVLDTGSAKWANAQADFQHGRRGRSRSATTETSRTPRTCDASWRQTESGSRRPPTPSYRRTDRPRPAPLEEAVANAMRRLEGALLVTALSRDSSSPSGTRTASARSAWAGWRTTGSPPRKRARSTYSARSTNGRSRAARSLSSTRTARVDSRQSRRQSGVRSASSSSSTSPGQIRVSTGSRCTPPRANGRAARAGGTRRADLVLPLPDSGHRRDRLLARDRNPVQRGLIKNRYVRAHVHPARSGLRQQGSSSSTPARGGRRQRSSRLTTRSSWKHHRHSWRCSSGRGGRGPRPISSPPVVSPCFCFYGSNFADEDELIAGRARSTGTRHIGATTRAHLSLEGLQESTRRPGRSSAAPA